jgi:hypothetical protein
MTTSERQPTVQEELDWITEHDDNGGPYADFIAASRYKAVYGVWPDGTRPPLPQVKGTTADRTKWLIAQSHPGKWIRAQIRAGIIQAPIPATPRTPAAAKVQSFAGQEKWKISHAARTSKQDAARSRSFINETITKLEQERFFLLTWFDAVRFQVDDAEWQKQFLKLQAVESMLQRSKPRRRTDRRAA